MYLVLIRNHLSVITLLSVSISDLQDHLPVHVDVVTEPLELGPLRQQIGVK